MAKYAFLHVEKIKTAQAMAKRCDHYTRKKQNEAHIDYSLTIKNEYLAGSKDDNFNTMFKNTVNALPYYRQTKMRSDCVRAFDILAYYPEDPKSKNYQKNLSEWKKRTASFIKERFGKENAMNIVLHLDEPDSAPHIHAIVFPVHDGRFSAKHYIDGPADMQKLQTDYADCMADLGYSRGVSGSRTEHQGGKDIQRIKRKAFSKHAPETKPGESAEQYRSRIDDEWVELQAANMIKDNALKRGGDVREVDVRKDKDLRTMQNTVDEMRKELASTKAELMEHKRQDYLLRHGIEIHPNRENLEQVYNLFPTLAERGEADLLEHGVDIDAAFTDEK